MNSQPKKYALIVALTFVCLATSIFAEEKWSLDKCISYALSKNISVQKADVSTAVYSQQVRQSQGGRLPTISASVGQSFSWSKDLNGTTYGSYQKNDNTTAGINADWSLFNGNKTTNTIKQARLQMQKSQLESQTTKESISLSVLDAYMELIFAQEQVKNYQENVKSAEEQVKLAAERVKIGSLSEADYLDIKAQLSNEQLTLVKAQNTCEMDRLTLMQLMELSYSKDFDIVYPNFDNAKNAVLNPDAESTYSTALSVKPQIKSAELEKQISDLDIKLAKAGYYPTLTLNGAVNTDYSSTIDGIGFGTQIENRVTPSIGATLSIPIYQQHDTKTAVEIAKLNKRTAELESQNVKNELRKNVEQSCLDVQSALTNLNASQEKFKSVQEAFNVAKEKYNVGLINSVDYVSQRTSYLTAQSELLQARINLIYTQKTLDFYLGKSLTL